MNIDALSPLQQAALIKATAGSKIVDLGGYDGTMAIWLLRHGADEVLVIDKERADRRCKHSNLSYMRCYFSEMPNDLTKYDTALLSWPVNNDSASLSLIPRLFDFKRIIYIGHNDNANMCGTPALWGYLVTRKIVLHLDGYPNCVLIYGEHGRSPEAKDLVREEMAGISAYEQSSDRSESSVLRP
jgi:hypothetical protein